MKLIGYNILLEDVTLKQLMKALFIMEKSPVILTLMIVMFIVLVFIMTHKPFVWEHCDKGRLAMTYLFSIILL